MAQDDALPAPWLHFQLPAIETQWRYYFMLELRHVCRWLTAWLIAITRHKLSAPCGCDEAGLTGTDHHGGGSQMPGSALVPLRANVGKLGVH